MKNTMKKFVIWLTTCKRLSFPRKHFARVVMFAIQSKGRVVISYEDAERRAVIELIRRIRKERTMLIDDNEAYQICMAVKRTRKIEGDIAEVGVYKGGSTKLICESNAWKKLHLFDTFDGLPNVSEIDGPSFHAGQFASSLEDVKDYLKGYKDVFFYKGLFPLTAKSIENKKFSFVHLDVDTYESTTSCLEFFYPRLNPGGIIISHDYINAPGVRKAFDEFFKDRTEPIIEMSGSQCLIVKL